MDAIVTMDRPGIWIFGEVDSAHRAAGLGIVVEYAGASGAPRWSPAAPIPWDYKRFASSEEPREPDGRLKLVFRSTADGHHWTINGQSHPRTADIVVDANRRYRWVLDNQSAHPHPIHLHRHALDLVRYAGAPCPGIRKDVIVVPAWQQVEVDVTAAQPGPSLFHCHQQLHLLGEECARTLAPAMVPERSRKSTLPIASGVLHCGFFPVTAGNTPPTAIRWLCLAAFPAGTTSASERVSGTTGGAAEEELVTIRNILVPTDFSAASRDALDCARELAAALGARLHVLHVIEQTVAPNVYTELYVPPPSEYFESLEAAAMAQLEAWVPADDKVPFRVTLAVGLGAAAEEILRRIDENPKIDLVVMATHGRHGVARLVLGSVAERVVRGARCPVVTVKQGAGRSAARAA